MYASAGGGRGGLHTMSSSAALSLVFLTFQEVNDFPPLPSIKRVELFKAHEGDVVVWVVHNGQGCSWDAGVQCSAVRAENK